MGTLELSDLAIKIQETLQVPYRNPLVASKLLNLESQIFCFVLAGMTDFREPSLVCMHKSPQYFSQGALVLAVAPYDANEYQQLHYLFAVMFVNQV